MAADEAAHELEEVSEPETIFHTAIEQWWLSKEKNRESTKKQQGGSRDSNLRGDTMDGFRDALLRILVNAGVDEHDIFTGSQFSSSASILPSYFRASKNWDVVICRRSLKRQLESGGYVGTEKLVAVVEFKSQLKSIGNNQNNRIEESIGSAEDFWAAYENRRFTHLLPRPWLGYLFVGYYGDGDETIPVEVRQPLIPTDDAFLSGDVRSTRTQRAEIPGLSYAERYRIFLERMVARKKYDGACFLVTHEDIRRSSSNYRVLFNDLSGARFVDSLVRHVRAYYPD